MSGIRCDVEISAGVYETIKTYSKIVYEIPLNSVRVFDVIVDASGSDYRTDFAINKSIMFYFNETLEMKGIILKREQGSAGQLRILGMGWGEKKLSQVDAITNSWAATNTSGVIADDTPNLLDKQPAISKGTIEDQTVTNFRSDVGQSVLVAVSKLCQLTGQDWSIDDANSELDVEDYKGSASSVGNLVDGLNIMNVFDEEDATGVVKKVTVIGSGFGANQISTSTSTGSWTTGDAEITKVDKSIVSEAEAFGLAEQIIATVAATRYNYSFEVINPWFSFNLGDVITLDVDRLGITATELRIVKFKRIATPENQRLVLEVRGTTEREIAEDSLSKSALQKQFTREAQTMAQLTDDGTASSTEAGHDHASGSYGADFHLHSDGTLSADSHTSGTQADGGLDSVSYWTTSLYNLSDSWTDVGNSKITIGDANELMQLVTITVYIKENASADSDIYLRIKATKAGESDKYYPNSTGAYLWADSTQVANQTIGTTVIIAPDSNYGWVLQLQTKDIYNNTYDWDFISSWNEVGGHSHSIPEGGVSGNAGNNTAGVNGDSGETTATITDAGHYH